VITMAYSHIFAFVCAFVVEVISAAVIRMSRLAVAVKSCIKKIKIMLLSVQNQYTYSNPVYAEFA
jgi:hypothetical protein